MAKGKKRSLRKSAIAGGKIIIVYTSKYLTIEYWPKSGIMFIRWHGNVDGEIVKTEGSVIPPLIKKFKVSRVLNDSRFVAGRWDNISKWVVEVWFPAMFEAGVKYFAWILPQEYYALVSAKYAMPNDPQFVKAFGDKKAAYSWLWRTTLNAQLEAKVLSAAKASKITSEFAKEFGFSLLIANYGARTLRQSMDKRETLSVPELERAIEHRLVLKAMCEVLQIVHIAYTEKQNKKLITEIKKLELELAGLGASGKEPNGALKKKAYNAFRRVLDDYKYLGRPMF